MHNTYEQHITFNRALESEQGVIRAFIAVVESAAHNLQTKMANAGLDPSVHAYLGSEVSHLISACSKATTAIDTLADGSLLGDVAVEPDPRQLTLDAEPEPLAAKVEEQPVGEIPDEEKAKTQAKKRGKKGA